MAAIRRVLSSYCRGLIVVFVAVLIGVAVPASAGADPSPGADPAPALTLTVTCDHPKGVLVWADDEVGYEIVGASSVDARLGRVTVSDDLSGVLRAASLTGRPTAVVTHPDGSVEKAKARLNGTRLTWTGALAGGDTVRLTYSVTVGLMAKRTTLHNVVKATWVDAESSTQATATAEASNPVNPVAIDADHRGSKTGAGKTLANTGIEGSAGVLGFAGALLAFGMALVAVRRRD